MKRRTILTLSCLVAGLSAGASFAQSRHESIDSYDFPRLNLYLRANNLLNRTWYDFGDIPQPGLWLIVGVSCKLPC